MFTGIVEELGEVTRVERFPDAARLAVRAPLVSTDARPGDSVAVNGVCLTVTELAGVEFRTDVMLETLRRSSLGALRAGSRVNLERPLTLATRLGGHLVQGHVDAVGQIRDRTTTPHWELLRVGLPETLSRYLVEKGSITVDGVSLTVVDVGSEEFTVSLIPATLQRTTLGRKGPGDPVNLEVDVLAKYAEKLLAARLGSL